MQDGARGWGLLLHCYSLVFSIAVRGVARPPSTVGAITIHKLILV